MCVGCLKRNTILCSDCEKRPKEKNDEQYVSKRAPILEYSDDVSGSIICDFCVHEFPCKFCFYGDII